MEALRLLRLPVEGLSSLKHLSRSIGPALLASFSSGCQVPERTDNAFWCFIVIKGFVTPSHVSLSNSLGIVIFSMFTDDCEYLRFESELFNLDWV